MENEQKSNYKVAFIVVTMLFFMWGFITCMNDILIPFLKKMFLLQRWESMMVQFTFFAAYFIGSVIYFIYSVKKGDPISKIGYKNGILLGLFISAFACLLIYPSAAFQSFPLFLIALFILGLGFTLLQIAANPYVTLLGPSSTASSRLNLSQAFNSLGTTLAPIIGGYLVFSFFAKWGSQLLDIQGALVSNDLGQPLSSMSVQLPYIIFAVIFILIAIVIKLTHLPAFSSSTNLEKGMHAFKYRQLKLGMIAIFVYVGAEVAVGSAFINYSKESMGFPEMKAKAFLAFYWGGLMIGRFLGSMSLGSMPKVKKYSSMLLFSLLTFLLIWGVNYITMTWFENGQGLTFNDVWPYLILIVINYIGFILGRSLPGRTLMIFSFIAIALLGFALVSTGQVAFWSIIGLGLFNSIMWSNIFSLAIDGMGEHTSQGSSLLVMMILGGAILPVLVGAVADVLGGYHNSFYIPIFCYFYLAFYGWKGYKPRISKQ
ncbi:MAG: sugar MFS transporter [Bacteroidota bacterium]